MNTLRQLQLKSSNLLIDLLETPVIIEVCWTGFIGWKPVQQTSIITGVSKRSIRRFDEQQTFQDSLEPQKHLTGRRPMVLPDWCLELSGIVRHRIMDTMQYNRPSGLLYCVSFWFCSTAQNIGIFLVNACNLYIPNSITLNYYNIVFIYMVLVWCPVLTLSKKLSSVTFNNF